MIATIKSIHLGDYHASTMRYGCFVSDESSVEFGGDIGFSSDEWDISPVLYKYNEFGFGLVCDSMRRFCVDHYMHLKPDAYNKMILSVSKYMKDNLQSIVTEFLVEYNERRAKYIACLSDLVIPNTGTRKDQSLERQRALRKRLSESGIDPVVYSDYIDFSHIINTPIVVS
jgi:hypothetical protein